MNTIGIEKIESYKRYLTEGEKAESTIDKYMRDVTKFRIWADGREIDKCAVIEYKEKLMAEYKPKSVNSILSSLNSLFEYLGWVWCKVKTLKIQRQTYLDEDKELTQAEYERLIKASEDAGNRRLSYLMQTICSTGIRVSELKFITVQAVNRGQADINCKGKMRTIFIPRDLCKLLKGYIKEQKIRSGPVFITKSGKPLNRSNIWSDMKRLCESAGVSKDKVFPHNLRHLFARTYYSLERDIVRLADILGHSSINTTRIYTMESGEVHRRQIECLGLLKC